MLKLSVGCAISTLSIACALPAVSSARAAEQKVAKAEPTLGTTSSPTVSRADAAKMANVAAGAVATTNTYTNAQYATASVALRNRAGGLISLSGVAKPVKAAFLYWAVIDNGSALASEKTVTLTTGPGAPTPLKGKLVGTGPSPCWGGTNINVYKATVPSRVVSDNGTYQVTLSDGSFGSATGGDPWVEAPSYPLWDGASLVVVGTGSSRVSLFDKGLAGNTFTSSFSYTLQLSGAARSPVLFESIGADGQIGISRSATAGVPGKTTTINGVSVAGPGSTIGDSDYDGRAGSPLPLLWDDAGHDISAAASGATSLRVAIGNTGDCATPVVNVVQY